jgi:hypothetical protein
VEAEVVVLGEIVFQILYQQEMRALAFMVVVVAVAEHLIHQPRGMVLEMVVRADPDLSGLLYIAL